MTIEAEGRSHPPAGGGPSPQVELSIVAPAYNEEENLTSVIRHWESVLEQSGVVGEIVIANDGSTDSTGEVLGKLRQEFSNIVVVNHETNGGYGRAMASAIAASRGELVLMIDSDGQFDAADFPKLMRKLVKERLDGVTGYRARKQDSVVRVLADRVLNIIVRLLFRIRFTDTNCALKLFRGQVIRAINIEAMGFPTPTEVLVKCQALGFSVGELAVSHLERAAGRSKLRTVRTGWEMLIFLLYLRLKVALFRRRIIRVI